MIIIIIGLRQSKLNRQIDSLVMVDKGREQAERARAMAMELISSRLFMKLLLLLFKIKSESECECDIIGTNLLRSLPPTDF